MLKLKIFIATSDANWKSLEMLNYYGNRGDKKFKKQRGYYRL